MIYVTWDSNSALFWQILGLINHFNHLPVILAYTICCLVWICSYHHEICSKFSYLYIVADCNVTSMSSEYPCTSIDAIHLANAVHGNWAKIRHTTGVSVFLGNTVFCKNQLTPIWPYGKEHYCIYIASVVVKYIICIQGMLKTKCTICSIQLIFLSIIYCDWPLLLCQCSKVAHSKELCTPLSYIKQKIIHQVDVQLSGKHFLRTRRHQNKHLCKICWQRIYKRWQTKIPAIEGQNTDAVPASACCMKPPRGWPNCRRLDRSPLILFEW